MNGNERHSDLNVTWTAIAGFVGGILIFAFIVAVQIFFQRVDQAQTRQKVVAEVPEQLSLLRTKQLARINSYCLVDEKKGLAAIPVEQAMEAFVRDPAESMRAIEAAAQPAATAPAGGTTRPAATSGPAAAQPALLPIQPGGSRS